MQFPLELTKNNVNKLLLGRPTQLKKEQLNSNKHYIKVHPLTHAKLSKAKASGVGLRLTMTQPELEESEGFMDILRGIKKGAKYIKDKVIDSNFYQQDVKPVVRKAVDIGLASANTVLPGVASTVLKAGADKLGEVTNAYGLIIPESKSKRGRPKGKKLSASQIASHSGGSFLIN